VVERLPEGAVDLSGAGQIEFYSPTGIALDALMPGPTDDESGGVRVIYLKPPQPRSPEACHRRSRERRMPRVVRSSRQMCSAL